MEKKKLLKLLLGEMQCELVNLKKLQELQLKHDTPMEKPKSGGVPNVDTMETMPLEMEAFVEARAGFTIP